MIMMMNNTSNTVKAAITPITPMSSSSSGFPSGDEQDSGAGTGTIAPVRPSIRTQTDRKSKTDNKPKQPWLWNVVLLDDDDHSYDYVIHMMQKLFGQPIERAFKTAQTVDADGRVVVLTTHKEHAELKRDQIHAFGKDPLMARSKGPMSAIIEPAEFGGDDDSDQGGNNKDV